MAVITTAIAVGAAAALSAGAVAAGVATVATVATIGAVVAAAGVAMTVVGSVTKNKDLLKVGEIMTGVGAGAGLGALAASAFGLGVAGAAGGSAGAGASAAAPAAESASTATSVINPQVSASVTQSLAQAGQTGAGTVLAPAVAQSGVGAGTVLAPAAAATEAGSSGLASTLPLATQAGQTGAKLMAGAPPPTPTPVQSPAPQPTPQPVSMAGLTDELGGVRTMNPAQTSSGGWSSLDPSTKLMIGLAGGQAATGLIGGTMSGMFQAQSASQQADIERQRLALEQQNLANVEAQREFLREGGRYAPVVSFNRPTGMIGRRFPSLPA